MGKSIESNITSERVENPSFSLEALSKFIERYISLFKSLAALLRDFNSLSVPMEFENSADDGYLPNPPDCQPNISMARPLTLPFFK